MATVGIKGLNSLNEIIFAAVVTQFVVVFSLL